MIGTRMKQILSIFQLSFDCPTVMWIKSGDIDEILNYR